MSSSAESHQKTIGWGIIGCGDVVRRKSGPAFTATPGSRLVTVMRRSEEGARAFAEDGWGRVRLGALDLVCAGPCQRCQMVCIDQATGARSAEPLRTLTRFRRLRGRTFFGQHVALASLSQHPVHIAVGDTLSRVTL